MKPYKVCAGVGALLVGASAAGAGVVTGTGTVSIWGNARAYRTWDVYQDPTVFIGVDPVEGRPRGMTFHNGSLYFVGAGSLIDTGPVRYAPGASGDLSSPTTIRVPVQPSDPRRWLVPRAVAINTSGAGYGAFSGADPVLTTVAKDFSGSSSRSITLGVTGSTAAPGTPIDFSFIQPSAIEYAPSIDRFLSTLIDINPTQTTVSVHTHSAAGMTAVERSFTAMGGIKGLDVISGSFATGLLGAPVGEAEVILAFGHNDIGLSDPAFLAVYSLDGLQLGTVANVPLAPLVNASSIAVDEVTGNIYLGDGETFTITVVTVPGPGAWTVGVVAAAGAARRRRR